MAEITKTYKKVKNQDISNVVDTVAVKGAQADRRVKSVGEDIWGALVLSAVAGGWLNQNADSDEKDISKDIKKYLEKHLLKSVAIPATGKNFKGESFEVQDDKGNVKWRSWEKTKVVWGYTGDLAKVVKAGIVNELTEDGDKVLARCDALKLAKVAKSPLEVFKGHLDNAEKAFEGMDSADKLSAHKLLESFITILSEKA